MAYLSNLIAGIKTTILGLRLTWRHMLAARPGAGPSFDIADPNYFVGADKGLVSFRQPDQAAAVPITGRYELHNEMDDCIVCDKCVKVCPVDCITIVPIKSATEIGKTSDGSPKRLYAEVFDIDMAKCCFCGLCTTVCPTECLTMTDGFDHSVVNITNMNFSFSNLTAEQAEQAKITYAAAMAAKAAAKAAPKPNE